MSDTLLTPYGLPNETVLRNLSPAALYEEAIRYDKGASIADSGALIAYSGDKTGRSPKDKRIVRDAGTEAEVWWGTVNIPIEQKTFNINQQRAIDYLATRPRLYVVDAFAGWDPEHRIKVRVVCERPYHALFMWTMLIRPTEQESAEFHLSMHCSATADPATGRSSVLFGLSGTGKTTLSADPNRPLIGDDEHVWSDTGVFNIEGGCYAKAIHLSRENEPEIFDALRFGSVLETEHPRGLPGGVHRQRANPLRGGAPHRRSLLDLRRLRRAATGGEADPRAGHVSLHQRLHREGGGHGDGRGRARGDV